jgi:TM2 domain-containing membrane protein YozV
MADEKQPDEMYCSSCGAIIKKEAEICPKCGVRQRPFQPAVKGGKNKVTAGVLAILLGGFGVHKFYLGYTGIGIVYLCFFWTFIPAIFGLVEGIIYLTKSDEEFYEAYVKNKKEFF